MTSSQPSTSCKIFVGGLAWGTTSESLRAHFEKYGTVIDATVMRDLETLKSRGFGFVLFANKQHTENALSVKEIRIDGRKVEVKRSLSREDAPPPISSLNRSSNRDGDSYASRSRDRDSHKHGYHGEGRHGRGRRNRYYSDTSGESRRSDHHNSKGSSESQKRATASSVAAPIPPPAGSRSDKDGAGHSSAHGGARDTSQSSEQRVPPRGGSVHGDSSRASESQRDRGDSVHSSSLSRRDTAGPSPPSIAARKIFVGGLHYGTGEEALREYFQQFGVVQFAQVLYNRETSRSRGFGFVIFSDESEGGGGGAVDRVLDKGAFHRVDGKDVEIKRAIPKEKDRDHENHAASSSQTRESSSTSHAQQRRQSSASTSSASRETKKQSAADKGGVLIHSVPASSAPADPWSGPNKGSLAMRLKMSMMESDNTNKSPLTSMSNMTPQSVAESTPQSVGLSEISPHLGAKSTPPGPLGLHSPLMSGEDFKPPSLGNDTAISELLLDRPSNASVVSIARTFASSSYTCGEQGSMSEFAGFSDDESDTASGWAAARFAATDLVNDLDDPDPSSSKAPGMSGPHKKHKEQGSQILGALSAFPKAGSNSNSSFVSNRVRTISGTSDMMLSTSSRMEWNSDHPPNLTIQRARGITNDSTASSLFSFQFGGSSPLTPLDNTNNSPANPYLMHSQEHPGRNDSIDSHTQFPSSGMNTNLSHQVFPNQFVDNRGSPSLFGMSNAPRPLSRMSEQNLWNPSGTNEFLPSHDAMVMQQSHQNAANAMNHARMAGSMPQANMPYMNHFASQSFGVAPLEYFVNSLEKSAAATQMEPNSWDQPPNNNNLGVGMRMQPINEIMHAPETEAGNSNHGTSKAGSDSSAQQNAGYPQGTLHTLRNSINFQ